jgi:pimeloyl-ACP methyl ester carboxylesterase
MSQAVETKTVPTRIGQLHVELRGQGPSLLCWPSLYCDARTLDWIASDLARDHRVLVVDGPGHGNSGASPGRFSSDDAADAAIDILDATGAARVTWIGAAWGGHVGVCVARRYPERLAGLVVMNTPMARWRGRRLALMRLSYALLWLFGPRSFVSRVIADAMIAHSAPDRGSLVDAVAGALRRCDRRGLLVAARSAMLEREDLVPVLSEVRTPTVFLAGAEDALFPVEEAQRQAAVIPECRFVVVERSSHQSALEAPERVLPVVREALAEWSARV